MDEGENEYRLTDDDLTAGLDLGFEGAEDILRAWRRGMRPDPDLTVSEWADQHRWLSSRASAEPGRYRTARTPYLRGIMDALKLILDAHASIAFLAGSVLDVKSAVQVSLVQKGRVGARIWRPDDGSDDGGKRFKVANYALGGGGDIAVAVSVAQPVEAHVRRYLSEQLPQVGELLTFGFPEGAGHQVVAGGAHAAALAEQVANQLRAARQDHPDAVAHIFAAVPNSMMFFLGQHHQSIAPCVVYEFDFDRKGNKSYHPSIVFD